jgi:hypothetical protein
MTITLVRSGVRSAGGAVEVVGEADADGAIDVINARNLHWWSAIYMPRGGGLAVSGPATVCPIVITPSAKRKGPARRRTAGAAGYLLAALRVRGCGVG